VIVLATPTGAYSSTDPKMNPAQRPTGWGTYFQAIWDTVNLSDFGIEIWLAIKFFFNFLRGVEGTRSQPTKMQQTWVFRMAAEDSR